MRLSVFTLSASLFITLIHSACLSAQPVGQEFQVNPLKSNTAKRTIQPTLLATNNDDPDLAKIARFFSKQRQLMLAGQAGSKPTASTSIGSINQQTQTVSSELLVRLTEAETPRQIQAAGSVLMKKADPTQSGTGTSTIDIQTARQFLNHSTQLLHLDNPDKELKLASNTTDTLGKQHLRFQQYYQNLEVWNSVLTVHLNKTGDVELIDGVFFPTPRKLSIIPVYSEIQATENARLAIPHGASASESNSPRLVIYPEQGKQTQLAWEIKLSAGLNHQWLVLIDAHNGNEILAYNLANDAATTGSAQDLFGNQRTLNIFEESSQFFLADTSKPMFKGGSPFPLTSETGAIYILDDNNQSTIDSDGEVELPERLALASSQNRNSWPADAVSAAFSLSETYDYYSEVHSRNSIDGNGGSIFALVRVGTDYFNAFWNGQIIAFGDAVPFAGALDVVAHELTHGVIQNTSNLIYLNQSGALNEALCDIFGEATEAHTNSQADWVIGAQLGTPLRNLRDPGALNFSRNRPYPATMSDFVQLPPTPEGDLGGIHINSTIIGHAFYLLAEGLNGAIGINDAEQIFYRAMTLHLVPRSEFIDTRLAVIQSATEIYGENSIQTQKAAEAFDAVEIFDAPPTPVTSVVTTIDGSDATVFIEFNPGLGGFFLKRRDPSLGDSSSGTILSNFDVAPKRPSVDNNTGLITFVDSNQRVCTINSRNTRQEECLTLSKQINSVAISPDGQSLAVVFRDASGAAEKTISIIDLASSNTTQVFNLVAPATEGASTTTIIQVDEMDFTNDGQFLIYDAFNSISTLDGSRVSVWSIYALDLVNKTIIALVPPVVGLNFAFPSLSQTTDDYLTFDVVDVNTRNNTITAASLITGEKKTIGEISGFSVPSYTGDDSGIIYSRADIASSTSNSALFRQPLESDRITPAGTNQLWLSNADFGVIYRRGDSITTTPVGQETIAKEGLWWIPSKPGSGFDIQITGNNDLFMVWYTYTIDGKPIWYLASGPLDGNRWRADILEFTWDGSSAISNTAGSVELVFTDRTNASLNWTLNTGNGSADIEYFAFDQADTVSAGTWFEQAQPGYGLSQVTQGSTQVNVLYFYDLAGNPSWTLGSGPTSEKTTVMNSFSGSCPVCPFNTSVASGAGTITTTFTNQSNGTLSTDIVLPSPLLGTWQIFDAIISNLSD